MKPVIYKWISNNEQAHGFIAHELQEVYPEAVSGTKDAVYPNGEIKSQGVDYGKITPVLTKAIQEQQNIIEELQNENTLLKEQIQTILQRLNKLESN